MWPSWVMSEPMANTTRLLRIWASQSTFENVSKVLKFNKKRLVFDRLTIFTENLSSRVQTASSCE